jgi:hypothetical protein
MTNLTQLTTLIIDNIESNYIQEIVNHLSSLPILSSLTITSIGYIKNQNDVYKKIFRLPGLKYCQMLIDTRQHLLPLYTATNKFSSIEYLVINNKVSLNQVDSLLSYVPQLRRLSFGHLNGSRGIRIHKTSISLNYLTDVSLELYDVSFNDFELLVTNFFRQVQVLRIAICCTAYFNHSMEYLNADRWERLISTHMANLSIFDFQHQHRIARCPDTRATFEAQVNKFNSLFWMKRQWFFEYQYQQITWTKIAIFYSTNPYR